MTNDGKLGIYVHIPFCLRKCNYCDFYSVAIYDPEFLKRYVQCLTREIKSYGEKFPGVRVETIYFGGGTPNVLAPEFIGEILHALAHNFAIDHDAEISMEANPYQRYRGNWRLVRDAGINRVSLGAQSFNDQDLKVLGRLHTTRDILESVEALHSAGFKNLSLDLIYGIPGQTIERWQENLKTAVDCQPGHISAYLLQPGERTPMAAQLAREELHLLDEDTEAAMYYGCLEYLNQQKFQHYEISNFAKSGYECRHNLRYWQGQHYLGLGPGAVSFIDRQRYINEPQVKVYMDSWEHDRTHPVKVLENMSDHDLLVDAIILGLRLSKGIKRSDFLARFGVDIIDMYWKTICTGIDDKLLSLTNDTVSLTTKGYFLANQVLCQFLT